ncbi:transmembrane sensor [Parabacteroides sp. PF5-5]|uniref:FecR family protein n=1 Tax=unclassified Parabacteroides TaxID=2649774 RepID=UPI0024756B85|nr:MULTISPECIES: FecR domain-containing protein [unclassified Parabacteroides]MDH6304152.1 transmembrane sensor [Parabacteroides sp. PH5-39]MDH6315148.1 transmembrane sensor [Parabacteroides sp. PF5-13]MDH6318793.1 transmembrane sensor [Parabacteroides sp. PH5-13]MDH6322522.1 transmembrane sensor [Parabacteroides sp. PH5-8]MDH6326326.1 transmembrane sensor [Parabacteroides sp. PH5-41]
MKTDNIKITPEWSKSKEEVWATAFEKLEDSPKVLQIAPRKRPVWFYVAASIAVVALILPSIAFFYTQSEIAERGTHLAVVLPDGSKVELNAESEISYKPLWWFISRDVKLKGEAYFEVEKGSTFDVRSEGYTVSVLGTSFNVFSRAGKFNVTCLSGKVNVSDQSESLTLTPNMQALWSNGKLMAREIGDAQESINWKQDKFVFVGVPLQEVIQEIERQYNIEVLPHSIPDYSYSGNFTKAIDPHDVLKIVGTPFGIEFKIK